FNADRFVVELHQVRTFDFRTQLRHDFPVYGNHSGSDELVSLAARANTGIRQELVQTNRFIRVYELFLVLNLFLHAIFSIRIIIGGTRTRTISSLPVIVKSRTVAASVVIVAVAAFSIIKTRTVRTVTSFTVVGRT